MSKISVRTIAFLLFSVIVFICTDFSLYQSQETHINTAGLQFYDMISSSVHQPVQALMSSCDNTPLPKEIRGISKNRLGLQNIPIKVQEFSLTCKNTMIFNRYVYSTAFGKECLSILALSYGSNSPPAYHF